MRRLRTCFVAALLLGACATADPSGGDDDGDDDAPIDASIFDSIHVPGIDAGDMPDAPPGTPQPQTITQSNSTNITAMHSLACAAEDALGNTTYTRENRFYRVFDLNALGITDTYTVNRVDFGVENAVSTAASQTVTIKLHTLSAAPTGNTFPLANLTQIGTKDVSVPNNTNVTMMQAMFTPAVVVPAGSRLVVEIFAGDRMPLGTGNYFFPGSNALGETGASYIYSMVCGVNDPTKYAVITTPDPAVHLVMSVQGTVP